MAKKGYFSSFLNFSPKTICRISSNCTQMFVFACPIHWHDPFGRTISMRVGPKKNAQCVRPYDVFKLPRIASISVALEISDGRTDVEGRARRRNEGRNASIKKIVVIAIIAAAAAVITFLIDDVRRHEEQEEGISHPLHSTSFRRRRSRQMRIAEGIHGIFISGRTYQQRLSSFSGGEGAMPLISILVSSTYVPR